MSGASREVVQVAMRTLQRAVHGLPSEKVADAVCAAAADLAAVPAASLCAWFDQSMPVPIGASDGRALLAEQIQFTTREGPCWQAYRSGAPAVHCEGPRRSSRALMSAGVCGSAQQKWPAYAAALRQRTGFTDAVALPLWPDIDLPLVMVLYDGDDLVPTVNEWGLSLMTSVPVVLNEVTALCAGEATWLDSSTTMSRAPVWLVEEGLMTVIAGMDRDAAQGVLRLYAMQEERTIDEVAADVHSGQLDLASVVAAGGVIPETG